MPFFSHTTLNLCEEHTLAVPKKAFCFSYVPISRPSGEPRDRLAREYREQEQDPRQEEEGKANESHLRGGAEAESRCWDVVLKEEEE